MQSLRVHIDNLHCQLCVGYVKDLLNEYFEFENSNSSSNIGINTASSNDDTFTPSEKYIVKYFDADLNSKVITIHFNPENFSKNTDKLSKKIWDLLSNAGFDIDDAYVVTDLENSIVKREISLNEHHTTLSGIVSGLFRGKRKVQRRRHRSHLEHCEYCSNSKNNIEESDNGVQKKSIEENELYEALLLIEGMSCASCVQKIENAASVKLNDKESIQINFLTKTAKVVIMNKQGIQPIVELIRELGYSVKLQEVNPIANEIKYKVIASIGGITCAACASSINNIVKELPFLKEHSIDVVSKVGIFIIDSNDPIQIDILKESIEDGGYEFQLIDEIKRIDYLSAKDIKRILQLRITGMYCEHCPEKVIQLLTSELNANIKVISKPTLKNPIVKFSYIPNASEGITVRSICKMITDSFSVNSGNNISVSIEKEKTIEEHLQEMSQKTIRDISIRLSATTLIAILTFVFGVVGMSLLSPKHGFRIWIETPIFHINVSRGVWILFFLSTPVYFFIADLFHRKAIKEITSLWRHKNSWRRRLFKFGSMNLLMSLGVTVAYFASIALLAIDATRPNNSLDMKPKKMTTYFDSVVFLTFFLLIGRLLESISKNKTTETISKLSLVKQHTATIVDLSEDDVPTNQQKLDVQYLEVGDIVKIVPGESPPSDCIVYSGETEFDESALTGESMPVQHIPGDQIFSGTVNVGRVTVLAKVASIEGDSLLDQIVSTVRDGQMKKAPVEKIADAITGYFVPIIILLAVITWVVWLGLGYSNSLPERYYDNTSGGWIVWSLEFAISVFVVACPCGIGLAAPTALFVGTGLAANNGILAKGGGAAFQQASEVSVICFDKTGTLTKGGCPQVTDFAMHKNKDIRELVIQVTHDMESNSEHPLARAVTSFLDNKYIKLIGAKKVTDTVEVAGCGIQGEINNTESIQSTSVWSKLKPTSVILGNERFMNENRAKFTSHHLKLLTEWKTQGKSVVIVSIQCEKFFNSDGYYPVLLMAVKDEVRPEAKLVIKQLQDSGIECWMISGDNDITANAIAKELGIDHVVAEVLPNQKADQIKWIQDKYKKNGKQVKVAMIGDGINDAPALANADIGVALASGSDLAMLSCDFVLLSSQNTLESLLTLFELSKKIFRRVYFNFGWALLYNMVSVPIAAGVIYPYHNSRLSPVWASAAMALSSVSVVLSSLALKFYKPKRSHHQALETTTSHTTYEPIEQSFN